LVLDRLGHLGYCWFLDIGDIDDRDWRGSSLWLRDLNTGSYGRHWRCGCWRLRLGFGQVTRLPFPIKAHDGPSNAVTDCRRHGQVLTAVLELFAGSSPDIIAADFLPILHGNRLFILSRRRRRHRLILCIPWITGLAGRVLVDVELGDLVAHGAIGIPAL
jgi:hypothetical protein